MTMFGPMKIIFLGGKGGVGKSLVAASVARIVARTHKVAVIDADLEGSNLATIFGRPNEELKVDSDGHKIIPILVEPNLALVCVSALPYLQSIKGTVLWEKDRQEDFLKQVLNDVKWPWNPDFLFVDCPAGVGSAIPALKSIYKTIDGAVLITTPAKVATENAEGVVVMLKDLKIPILGMLQNMTYFQCPKCNHKHSFFGIENAKALAKKHDINIFGELPFDPDIPYKMDNGMAINHDILVEIGHFIINRTKIVSRVKYALFLKH